jgi:hypothetical protein
MRICSSSLLPLALIFFFSRGTFLATVPSGWKDKPRFGASAGHAAAGSLKKSNKKRERNRLVAISLS